MLEIYFFYFSLKMENIIFIDLETSGIPITKGDIYYLPSELNFYDDSRIVEIAYLICTPKNEELLTYREIIKPDNFIIKNDFIHGIKHEDAIKNGKSIKLILEKLLKNIFNYNVGLIVCHNINFDVNILLSECYRNLEFKILIEVLNLLPKYCTCRTGSEKYTQNEKHIKLIELYGLLFNEDFEGQHNALNDTKACARCYFAINCV